MPIIPAILEKSFFGMERKAALVKGVVDTVQVDICDGRFADNKTWPYEGDHGEFARITNEEAGLPFWDELDYEFDLMVKEPEGIIGDYVKAGATRLLVHLESTKQLSDIIREWGNSVEIGIALRPSTPLEDLDPYMHEVRHVQCMGADLISHGGVSLDSRVPERVRTLRAKYPEHGISVDIGVNFETAPVLVSAGATHLIAGSAIFKSVNPHEAIRQLNRLFNEA